MLKIALLLLITSVAVTSMAGELIHSIQGVSSDGSYSKIDPIQVCVELSAPAGQKGGAFEKGQCADFKEQLVLNKINHCLDVHSSIVQRGPTFTESCATAVRKNFESAFTDCVSRMSSFNIDKIGPSLLNLISNAAKQNKCKALHGCLREIGENEALGATAIDRCSRQAGIKQENASVEKDVLVQKISVPSSVSSKPPKINACGILSSGKKVPITDEKSKVDFMMQMAIEGGGSVESGPCE